MQRLSRVFQALTGILLLGVISIASAHGHDETNPTMGQPSAAMANTEIAESQTYFHHDAYAGFMTAHIILMTIGWVFMLPVGEYFVFH
jgi:hypothetical protein